MDDVGAIVTALETVHASSSTSDQRRQAQQYLETLKHKPDCPVWGWELAKQPEAPAIVRHFGLALLHHAVTYHFIDYDQAKREVVRDWVIQLSRAVVDSDPHYIREKVASLWVAVAKRVWGLSESREQTPVKSENGNTTNPTNLASWPTMDLDTFQLWAAGDATRDLSLSIWRTLFEDLFLLEDPVASARAAALTAQCTEITTSKADLADVYENRSQALISLRYGDDGWLQRWSDLLGACLDDGLASNRSLSCAISVLETLKASLQWVLAPAIRHAHLLDRLSRALTVVEHPEAQMLTVDCLNILFTRQFPSDADFETIVGAVFSAQGIATLAQVYQQVANKVNADEAAVDDRTYVLLKRMVELIVGLSDHVLTPKTRLDIGSGSPRDSGQQCDFHGYLKLVLATTAHVSPIISGFALPMWCSILRSDALNNRDDIQSLLPDLLAIACDHCLKYEELADSHPARLFLEVDFDQLTDGLSFLGNYRRFITDIVRLVVCQQPEQSLKFVKSRMEDFFNSDLGWQAINSAKLEYTGNPAFYLAYSQLMLIEPCLHGVTRWRVWFKDSSIKQQRDNDITTIVVDLCSALLQTNIRDLALLRKMIQILVQFAPVLRDTSQDLVFSVLERVLTTCTTEYGPDSSDDEREVVRDLRTSCGTELNRLAYMMPDGLMQIYGDLERVIAGIVSSGKLSDHETVAFESFLLVVSQRSHAAPQKVPSFAAIVDPVLSRWSDEATMKGLMDLQWFMERLGIVKIAQYFISRGVTADTDLLQTQMDDTGRELKSQLKRAWTEVFPIRATRIFIQYTIEKLSHSSPEYGDLLQLWKPRVQPILPHILQLTAQIQAYHNPANWTDLPAEVQAFVRYSCMERFWQVGVSTQTRDEFVDESVKATHTLRDFADSVGHIIRYTREYAFLTLGSISQLEETMYEMPDMANHLWTALAGDSSGITSHSWRHMITLVLRNVVKNCPLHLIEPFMSQFLPPMLRKLDQVLCDKWAAVYAKGLQLNGSEDDSGNASLSEEMMDEHLLRQLTAIIDRLLIDLVGQLGSKPSDSESASAHSQALRELIVKDKEILAPLLSLCNHIIAFKDVRCSFNCCLIVRNILPQILLQDPEVDSFLCDTMLKTCVDIVADPYFLEVHNEAGYILTTIYTVLRSQYQRPLDNLSQLFAGVSQAVLVDFESRLAEPKSLRQQKAVFLDFLAVMGEAKGVDAASRDDLRKRSERKPKNERNRWMAKHTSGNILDDEANTGIVDLFAEN